MGVVGIIGKPQHPELGNVLSDICTQTRLAGWEVLVEDGLDCDLADVEFAPPEQVAERADKVVVLGGDGTLIRAVRLLDEHQVPVFGVNLGKLGFLAAFTVKEAGSEFAKVLAGDYQVDERIRLQADLIREKQVVHRYRAFNDVVVSSGPISRVVDIQAEIDGMFVANYRADGLIVSTPSGSTAYSMAAGGPIVMPGTEAIILAPICPHMLTLRPLVVHDGAVIDIQVQGSNPPLHITLDGQEEVEILKDDRLSISRAPGRVWLVKPPRDHYRILRTKLRWGQW